MVLTHGSAASASPALPRCETDPTPTTTSSLLRTTLRRLSPNCLLGAAAVIMLASATFDTMATKFMNRQRVPPCLECESRYFEAPFLQTWTGYLGEVLFFPIYLLDCALTKKAAKSAKPSFVYASPQEQPKPHCPPWQWIVPLSLDLVSTVFLNYATLLIQASAVQILRSFNIMIMLLLSVLVLRNNLFFHQALGVGLALLGIVSAACFAMVHPDAETNYGVPSNKESSITVGSKTAAWFGVIAALLGTTLGSVQWIVEERLFRKYSCSPIEAVAWMGLFGVLMSGLVLQFAHLTGLEDVRAAFFQMSLELPESKNLLLFNVLYIFSLAINTAAGITVTKLASSLLRAMVNAARAVSIWLMEILVGWQDFKVLSGSALLLVVVAIFIYNYNFFGRLPPGHWLSPWDALLRRALCRRTKNEFQPSEDDRSDMERSSIHGSGSPTATTARPSSPSSMGRDILPSIPDDPRSCSSNVSPGNTSAGRTIIRRSGTPAAPAKPAKFSADNVNLSTPIPRPYSYPVSSEISSSGGSLNLAMHGGDSDVGFTSQAPARAIFVPTTRPGLFPDGG